jgi:hypothetical protein
MGKRPPAYQPLRARGLRRVTLLVPESCAMGLRDLALVLRTQQRHRTVGPPRAWRRLSPSTELMVDPRSGRRCAIRDTRAAGAERYYWTVTVFGEPDPVAAGRTAELQAARLEVETTLAAYAGDWDEMSTAGNSTNA